MLLEGGVDCPQPVCTKLRSQRSLAFGWRDRQLVIVVQEQHLLDRTTRPPWWREAVVASTEKVVAGGRTTTHGRRSRSGRCVGPRGLIYSSSPHGRGCPEPPRPGRRQQEEVLADPCPTRVGFLCSTGTPGDELRCSAGRSGKVYTLRVVHVGEKPLNTRKVWLCKHSSHVSLHPS